MWLSFSRHSPNWRVVKNFHSPSQQVRKQLAQYTEIISERENKTARLAIGFVFLLAIPKLYSHLASWRGIRWYPQPWCFPLIA
jgi:hypothetical protein